MSAKTIVRVLLVTILAGLTAQAADTEADLEQGALAVAQTWLALNDKGAYVESWTAAAEQLRKAVTQEAWIKTITSVNTTFGKVESRKLGHIVLKTTLPGAPDGKYAAILFNTRFAHKQAAIETVGLVFDDEDETWHVCSYHIR